jgi:hypothetical protein
MFATILVHFLLLGGSMFLGIGAVWASHNKDVRL